MQRKRSSSSTVLKQQKKDFPFLFWSVVSPLRHKGIIACLRVEELKGYEDNLRFSRPIDIGYQMIKSKCKYSICRLRTSFAQIMSLEQIF